MMSVAVMRARRLTRTCRKATAAQKANKTNQQEIAMNIISIIQSFIHGFLHGPVARKTFLHQERQQHQNMDDDQIDSMVDDTFPASDPPGTY